MASVLDGILKDYERLRRDVANLKAALRFNRTSGSVVMARDLPSAVGGSFYVAKAAAALYAPMPVPSSGTWTMTLLNPPSGNYYFANGDICRITALVLNGDDYDTKDTWYTVGSRAIDTATGTQSYTCTYQSGDKGWTYPQGVAVVDYGASGQGYLVLTADGANAPRYSIYTHAGAPWTTQTERGRFGNMNGAFGVSADVMGFGVGDYANGNYLKYDTAGGFTIQGGTGAILIDEDGLSVNGPNINIKDATGVTLFGTIGGDAATFSVGQGIKMISSGAGTNGLELIAGGTTGHLAAVSMTGSTTDSTIYFVAGDAIQVQVGEAGVYVLSGLNLGTSDGAADGNIEMSGSIKESTAIGARVYRSTDQTLGTASLTAIAFDAERFDTDTIHSTSSNTERLTCKTAGVYVITGTVRFASNATGNRRLLIRFGGSTYIAENDCVALSSLATTITVSAIYSLAVDEYVELVALQSSGGDLAVSAVGNVSPEFGMVRVA